MNKVSKFFLITTLTSCAAFQAGAKMEKVEILGNTYYVYVAKKDDTLFGIAREMGWNDEELHRINPTLTSPLAKGTKVYYPCLTDDNEGEIAPAQETNPEFYTIKRGDTLYQLAKKYDTTVAAILQLNPGVSEKNFRADDVIKLPARGVGKKIETVVEELPQLNGFDSYKVKKNDTWESVADKTGVNVETLKEANNTKKLKNNELIGIPVISMDTVTREVVYEDPREMTISGIEEIYQDVHGLTADSLNPTLKIGIVLSDPSTRKDMDFTRGFLTAVNRNKISGYKLDVRVFDGKVKTEKTIDDLSQYDPTLIFTTSDHNVPAELAQYAWDNQVPLVNTFDLKDEQYATNPYVIQLLTPSGYFNEAIANNIKKNIGNAELLIVGEDDSDQMCSAIEERWTPSYVKYIPAPELLEDRISSTGKYVIYGLVNKKSEIENLVKSVIKIRENYPGADITFIGRPAWLVYDEAMKDEFHAADLRIPSRFFYDKDDTGVKGFNFEYKALFNMTPVKSYPMYAAMGYDTASYFIPAMAKTGGDLNALGRSESTLQSDFELERLSNWSGFINPVVYMVRFSPWGVVEKIKIK